MPVAELCTREVVVVNRSETVLEAAKLMRHQHVGDVVVVEEGSGIPVGIVTDRDIVVEIIANGLDPASISVGEIMVPELATVGSGQGLFETIEYMRSKGVRRLPVVGEDGKLIGILALDDILELLAEELSGIARLVKSGRKREERTRL